MLQRIDQAYAHVLHGEVYLAASRTASDGAYESQSRNP